jgi:hypothetical protein
LEAIEALPRELSYEKQPPQAIGGPHRRFGSYHPGICQFVKGDGSVPKIPVGIDIHVLTLLAVRNDGMPVLDF